MHQKTLSRVILIHGLIRFGFLGSKSFPVLPHDKQVQVTADWDHYLKQSLKQSQQTSHPFCIHYLDGRWWTTFRPTIWLMKLRSGSQLSI